YYFALPGAQVTLEALATDSNYNPSNAPGAYTFSSDSKGTISGNIFTAGTQTGLAEVSVTWGGISSRQNIAIIQGITNIRLSKKGENTALTGLNLDRDATLDLQAAATYRGNEVAASNELFQWQVTGNIGEISPDGRFIANGPGSSGSISASYNGVKAQVNINLAGAYQIESRLIADFEQNQPFAGSSGWQLSRTRLADQVKSGRYALKAEYDFNQASDLNLTAPADAGTGKYFHFWLMGDASAFSLSAKFTDSQGEIIYAPVDTRGAPKTYQCLQAEVPAGAVNFTGFSLSKGNAAQGVFYLDQIFFSDQSPADSNPPGLTFLNPPAQAANGQNIQFSVKA
ncbi:MAG: hypothetical protein LBB91_02975, partial [Clostridiales bacterium]|nr:hypothetical protein [Clostridiales bacterium]